MSYTNGDAVDIIRNEGLDYAVRHYCDGSYFDDVLTRRLWHAAERALNELVQHLERQTGQSLD